MTEPTTEADLGRRNIERYLDHEYGISTNDAEIAGLLDGWRDAIEAEAEPPALDVIRTAFDEYLWGLSISPNGGPCEESVRFFRDALLARLAREGS